ncbi:DUF6204 family protein [Streptomyces sp. A1136]|uniref:DUF6204 family protein n=2 Tax=unclassified Streptomyces TaxID=2593676 RepID=UPI0027960E40|nr:DUF6204 family protein [Streptomyces sp. A1136]
MSPRTFRVTIRGAFDRLTDARRAELETAAPEHDLMRASSTEGDLSYDLTPDRFTFRFLDSGEAQADILDATARAELTAGLGSRSAIRLRAPQGAGPGHVAGTAEQAPTPSRGARTHHLTRDAPAHRRAGKRGALGPRPPAGCAGGP